MPFTDPNANWRREALKQILGVSGLAAGLGAGWAGLGSAMRWGQTQVGALPKLPARRTVLELPIPARDEEEGDGVGKRASGPLRAAALKLAAEEPPGWGSRALDSATVAVGAGPGPRGLMARTLWPDAARSPGDLPGYWPLLAGGALVGGGLGYGLVNRLFRGRAKSDRQAEVEDARARFHESLLGQYGGAKRAAGPDPLTALAEKQAGLFEHGLGGLLGLMAVSALASGYGAHALTRASTSNRAVERALRRREEELYAASPAPIVVLPRPVSARPQRQPGRYPDVAKRAELGDAAQRALGALHRRRQYFQQVLQPQPPGGAKKPAPAKQPGSELGGAPDVSPPPTTGSLLNRPAAPAAPA